MAGELWTCLALVQWQRGSLEASGEKEETKFLSIDQQGICTSRGAGV